MEQLRGSLIRRVCWRWRAAGLVVLGLVDFERANNCSPHEVIGPPLARSVLVQHSGDALEDVGRYAEQVRRVQKPPALAEAVEPVPGCFVEGVLPAEGREVEKSWIPLLSF